jgi:hypothetical protein
MTPRVLVLFSLLSLLLVPGTAHSTTLVEMELEHLVDQAELVFVGTALRSEVALSADGTFPFTFVTFEVQDEIKGRAVGRELTLRFHGGQAGPDEVVVVHGMPEFTLGETYLLFVRDNGTAASALLGWRQGQYRVAREPESGRQILVDERGAPIQGIENGRWLRGLPPQAGAQASKGTLLSEEGVTITQEAPGRRPRPARPPEASAVITSLKSFAKSRSGRPDFVPGRQVSSADPQNVPMGLGGSLSPGKN